MDRLFQRQRTFNHLAEIPLDTKASFNRALRIVVSDEALATRTGQIIAVTVVSLAARLTERLELVVGRAQVSGGVAVLLGADVLDAASLARLAQAIFPVTVSTAGETGATTTLGIGDAGAVSIGVGVDASGAAVVKAGRSVEIRAEEAPIAALIAAAVGVDQAAKLLYPGWLGSVDDIVTIDRGPFGGPLDAPSRRIPGRPIVAGVGAVGCAFVYALIAAEAEGELTLLDPDGIKDGNLARYILFNDRHVGARKIDIAAELLSAVGIATDVHAVTFADFLDADPTRRDAAFEVLSLVDSFEQRRSIARDLPRAILNAGTADRNFTVSRHGFDDGLSCLGCQYPERVLDVSLDAVMSRALFMDVDAVRALRLSKLPLDREAVHGIARARGSDPAAYDIYVGEPLDSLYNRLCSVTAVQTSNNGEVFAPIAYLSALAGFMVAAGLLAPTGGDGYFRMDVFSGLTQAVRRSRPRRPDCDICGSAALRAAYHARWLGFPV